MTKLAVLKKWLMADPEFQCEYAEADGEFQVIEALMHAGTTANLSQPELARRIGTIQIAIAKLEGGAISPSLSTLRKYAEATRTKLELKLVPSK